MRNDWTTRIDREKALLRTTVLPCIAGLLVAVACAVGQTVEGGRIAPLHVDAGLDPGPIEATGGAATGEGGNPSMTTGGVTSSGGNTGSGGRAGGGAFGSTGGRAGAEVPDGSSIGEDSGSSEGGANGTGGTSGAGGANGTGGGGAGGANDTGGRRGMGGAGGTNGTGGSQSTCNPNRCPSCLISGLLGASCCKQDDTCGCRPLLGLLPCG